MDKRKRNIPPLLLNIIRFYLQITFRPISLSVFINILGHQPISIFFHELYLPMHIFIHPVEYKLFIVFYSILYWTVFFWIILERSTSEKKKKQCNINQSRYSTIFYIILISRNLLLVKRNEFKVCIVLYYYIRFQQIYDDKFK